ncbi:MAG: uncharacterized protein KVP18_004925 [Porospora cf. gigantea A]|nr:MAG: hypothetical protein KVP18_004925 [Porospora cf. gigantea A]
MADQSWSLIDSDPIVFSTMIRELGVRDVDVEELYSLDDDGWQQLRHCVDDVYGFIFLVKIPTAAPEDPRPVLDLPNVFFAKQVVNNACASQALLSVLLNAEHVDLGPTLSDFKAFAIACDPETRGLCIGNSDEIRQVHNSFASKTGVAFEGEAPDDEAFHFVAYVPAAGGVVELDGLSRGPILCGKTDGGSWASLAMTAVREKIEL